MSQSKLSIWFRGDDELKRKREENRRVIDWDKVKTVKDVKTVLMAVYPSITF